MDPRVKPLFLPVGGLCLSITVWVKAQPIRVYCYLGKSVARGLTLHVFFNVFVSLFSLGYPFTQRIYFMSVRRGLLRRGMVGVVGFGKHRLTAYFRSVWPRQESTPCTERSGAWLPVVPSGCRFMCVSSMGRQVLRVQTTSCLKAFVCVMLFFPPRFTCPLLFRSIVAPTSDNPTVNKPGQSRSRNT